MQEKQRANDFEEELQLIQKHLKTTQSKVAEQVKRRKFDFLLFSISSLSSPKKSRISKQREMFTMHN